MDEATRGGGASKRENASRNREEPCAVPAPRRGLSGSRQLRAALALQRGREHARDVHRLPLRAVMDLMAGRSVLLITHRLSALTDLVDEVLVMEDGRIVQRGAPRALMNSAGPFLDLQRQNESGGAAAIA